MSHGSFVPVLVLAVLGVLVVAGMVFVPHLIARRRKTPVKQMPYESGMDPVGDARGQFDVRFYLVAIVFLLFDVELLFLYPWAVATWHTDGLPAAQRAGDLQSGWLVFGEVGVFMALLGLAYVYAWRRGVFDWR